MFFYQSSLENDRSFLDDLLFFKKTHKLIFLFSFFIFSTSVLQAKPASIESVSTQLNQPGALNYPIFYNSISTDNDNELLKILKLQNQLVDIAQLNQQQIYQLIENNNCVVSLTLDTTLKILQSRKKIKLFTINVSRNELDKLQKIYQNLNINLSGIYQEQTFERQILLTKSIKPNIDSITVFLDQTDKFYLPEMLDSAQKHQLKLNFKILLPYESVVNFLPQLTNNDEFLLISNNQNLYSEHHLANLVVAAAHQQLKLIGNTKNSLKLGALASIFSTNQDLILQASNEIKDFCENEKIIKPNYANYFSVLVNRQILEKNNLIINSQPQDFNNLNLNSLDLNKDDLTKNIIAIEKKLMEGK